MDIILRPWQTNELYQLVRLINNHNIVQFMSNQIPHPYTEEDGKVFLNKTTNQNPTQAFAITADSEVVGSIGIFPQTDIYEKNAEIGYWLGEEYWGRGIITEAIRQIVEYGFNTFDITRIFARPFSNNKASQRALKKAGFTHEATIKNGVYKNSTHFDSVIYAMQRGK
ncbi:MAG: GNAT family N-acetyltransferase [Prevotellaceae bacterium]|nr:GNAT family N-acetyltransferase [Prevotellaceae bacterium]